MKKHTYTTAVEWTGNTGTGTNTYRTYRRDFTVQSSGKPVIGGSSDPAFRGDPARYNPEDLLVAGVSSCHMLSYLHLCAINGITVQAYTDTPLGTMNENRDGSGEFVHVLLRPVVTVAVGDDHAKATKLHEEAHHLCFIARSVNFPIEVAPVIL